MTKVYLAAGVLLLANYAWGEMRGASSTGSDQRPSQYVSRTGGGGGGGVYWGSGYRGGK